MKRLRTQFEINGLVWVYIVHSSGLPASSDSGTFALDGEKAVAESRLFIVLEGHLVAGGGPAPRCLSARRTGRALSIIRGFDKHDSSAQGSYHSSVI